MSAKDMSPTFMSEKIGITVTVNGTAYQRQVEPRLLLVQFIRDELLLTGTHIGCDTSYCGACTVLLNDEPVKSCTVLAVQADGCAVRTVEGLEQDGKLHPLQQAFSEHHALQCGFCTPGMLMSSVHLLETNPQPSALERSDSSGRHERTCGKARPSDTAPGSGPR